MDTEDISDRKEMDVHIEKRGDSRRLWRYWYWSSSCIRCWLWWLDGGVIRCIGNGGKFKLPIIDEANDRWSFSIGLAVPREMELVWLWSLVAMSSPSHSGGWTGSSAMTIMIVWYCAWDDVRGRGQPPSSDGCRSRGVKQRRWNERALPPHQFNEECNAIHLENWSTATMLLLCYVAQHPAQVQELSTRV